MVDMTHETVKLIDGDFQVASGMCGMDLARRNRMCNIEDAV